MLFHFHRCGVGFIVLLVCPDEFDVGRAQIVGNGYDHPIGISLDIEHHSIVCHKAGARVLILDALRRLFPRY